jgi:hypothetical protein
LKVLFVHPHGSNWIGSMRDITSIFNLMPPLGLMSIAACLEAQGVDVDILDCYGTSAGIDELPGNSRPAPDVVASSTSRFWRYAIAELVRRKLRTCI